MRRVAWGCGVCPVPNLGKLIWGGGGGLGEVGELWQGD